MQSNLSLSPHSSPIPLFHPKWLFLKTRHPKLLFAGSATKAARPITTMYDLLSVTENAGLDEIKAAYRKVARKWHPDTCRLESKDFFTQQFIKVREAYEVLSDPVLREDYDYSLKNDFNGVLFRKTGIKKNGFGDWETQLEGLERKSSNNATSTWGNRMRMRTACS